MTHFCITVRWLDDRYHGLIGRDGPPEWPPSPFRLFQALVAGVARRGELDAEVGKSLEWLQSKPPLIIAPRSQPGQIVTRYVPNNDGDAIPDRQNRLTAKTFRPTIMLGRPEIHYIWRTDSNCPHPQLVEASRSLSCLGWGIDMAYADVQLRDELNIGRLSGVRWHPVPGTLRDDGLLRVPKEGSMSDLRYAHESALRRIDHGKPLRTVYKPRVFDRVLYTSAERPLGRESVVFALRTTIDDPYSYPHAGLIHIAGMVRHEAIRAMSDFCPDGIKDPAAWVDSFVAGHRPDGTESHERFSYVPLPSIGHQHTDAMIRRVMVTAPFGCESYLSHLASQLDGVQLASEGGGEGPVLWLLRSDGVTRQYLGTANEWASVSPVVLPGHDDHKPAKTVKLIEKALRQCGVDQPCEFTWSAMPYFPNCLSAHKYDRNKRQTGYYRPEHLQSLTAVHVRLAFKCPVAGPLIVGAGRHCGLGLFAALQAVRG